MKMSGPTVTVTAQTTTTKITPNLRYDPTYFKTIPGIIKIAQVLVSLVGFICVQVIPYGFKSSVGWYGFVSMTAFWVTLILIIFYVFHLIEKTHMIPWLLIETIYATIWTLCFFIAGCVAAANGNIDPAFGAAAFFAFVAMLLFGYEAFTKYTSWRSGDIAQGERTVTTNSPSSAPSYPTY